MHSKLTISTFDPKLGTFGLGTEGTHFYVEINVSSFQWALLAFDGHHFEPTKKI